MSRERWEAKHRDAEFLGEPSPFLREALDDLPRGRALDLACGLGPNALFLASAGYQVDALDWSVEGLAKLGAAARLRRLAVRPIACDVTRWPLPFERYDLVISVRFLERSLFAPMTRALRPDGALVVETFTLRHLEHAPDFPREYCLAPNELLTAFAKGFRVARYRELPAETTASLLAFRESTAGPREAAGDS